MQIIKYIKAILAILILLAIPGHGNSQNLTLPANFPAFTIDKVNNPDPGYLFLFARPQTPNKFPGYLTILDSYGTPVYYKYIPYQSGTFGIQRDGRISYLRIDGQANEFYLMNDNMEIIDSTGMSTYELDSHDFIGMANGHFLMFGLDHRTMDMSQVLTGGKVDATVSGTVIQELDENNNVVFEWNSFDHYQITDTYNDLTASSIDYVHPNSLEIDYDGNILLIARSMNEITKIDRQTGNMIWRLGGKNNQFTFADSTQIFSRPHDFKYIGGDHYTLFDNGSERKPQYSRAIEYVLNQSAKTIEMVWQYDADSLVYAPSGGSVQRLPSGNTLVCYGGQVSSPSVTEVHPDGTVAMQLKFADKAIRSGSASKSPWKTSLFSANTDTVQFGYWDGYSHMVYLLRIKNNSASPIELTGYSLRTNAFILDTNQFPFTLAPGAEKQLNLLYYPYDVTTAIAEDALTLNSDINSDTLVQRIAIQVQLRGKKYITSVPGISAGTVKVYPNPVKDLLNITVPAGVSGNMRLLSITGAVAYHQKLEGNTTAADISSLGKGIYILEVSDPLTGEVYRKKISKL
jgi:hypothetical protein